MASTSSSSGCGNTVRYQQTLDLVIGNFHLTQKQVNMQLQTSAFNEELKPYGEARSRTEKSRWVLRVKRQDGRRVSAGMEDNDVNAFVALEGNGDIVLMVRKIVFRIIDSKGGALFSHDSGASCFRGIDLRHRPLKGSDYKYIGRISYTDLAKNPQYTEGDCLRVRAEILFSIMSGGTPPATAVTIPDILPEPGKAPDLPEPDADEFILHSSDGRRFRVKKQLLNGIPYFDGIVKAIKNPQDGLTLCQDGETLENVLDFLKAKRVRSLELNKKLVMAADIFGLKELQEEAISPLVRDFSIENAEDVFRFAADNNIACLQARMASLIPSVLEEVVGANAAKALILSAKMNHPALQKKALDVIAGDVTEFCLADGFEEIASVPGLVAEVKKAIAEHRAAQRGDGAQSEVPAKKAKTTL